MKKHNMLCLLAATLLLPAFTQAQTNGFKTSFNLGATMTDGNSKTRLLNAGLVTEGEKSGLGSVRAGAEVNYGESTVNEQKSTTVDNAKVFGNVKKTISKMTFGSLDASVLYDNVAKVDYRATVGPGLGMYLVKNGKASIVVEAGPSYVWEKVAGVSDDYFAIRFAERIEYAFSDKAKVWQSAEYLPKAEDFSDYLLNAEAGAEAAMNSRVSPTFATGCLE